MRPRIRRSHDDLARLTSRPDGGVRGFGSATGGQGAPREGNCWDNAVAESFFGTLEQELGANARWASLAHARMDVGAWIHGFYNDLRLHSTIGFHSPVEFEALHRASITEAA